MLLHFLTASAVRSRSLSPACEYLGAALRNCDVLFALFVNGKLYSRGYDLQMLGIHDYVTNRSIDTVDYTSRQNSVMTTFERR